jgi:pimeloyl-ACP methyl ester carboxylesterase
MSNHELHHSIVRAGQVRLHVVQAGPQDGPPVILLHGFPDFWLGWRHQIEALAAAGYRVIVPDQRGYSTSDKPVGTGAYNISQLTGDVRSLADALGLGRFSLVGHDWGGIIAWACGSRLADRLDRLVILNAPHPETMLSYMLRDPIQLLRSNYMGWFQIPALPEKLLSARQYALLVRALRMSSSRADAFSDIELRLYRQAWSEPGALTAMINWYRAMPSRPAMKTVIEVPTLVLWGAKDPALGRGLATEALRFCADGYVQMFEYASHFVQRDEPAAVNAALLKFLAPVSPPQPG